MITVYVYAWFTDQKKSAEMFKVKFPNSLYINAAHREDQMFFELDGIDVGEFIRDDSGNIVYDGETALTIDSKTYVFTVSGANTNQFLLQLAHTNNNLFDYTLYEATEYTTEAAAVAAVTTTVVDPDTGEEMTKVDRDKIVEYNTHENGITENKMVFADDPVSGGDPLWYVMGDQLVGGYVNTSAANVGRPAIRDKTNKYYKNTYGSNENVQLQSVPSYWQGTVNCEESNRQFCKYFILKVTWNDEEQEQQTSKETDMVYFSVDRIS